MSAAAPAAVLLLCPIFESAAQRTREYSIRLAATPRDTSMRATVAGSGSARATLDGRVLSISGSFEGLKSQATEANIRMGAATAVRGPAIHPLEVTGAMEGTISGAVELSDAALEGLNAGRLYIQLDSESAPDGNLWGWILRDER